MADGLDAQALTWGMASRWRAGEATGGDRAVVTHAGLGLRAAVVDGVGHGPEAARAADAAVAALSADDGRDLVALMRRCHDALAGTRGAAVSLALLCAEERALTWLGVGNVEGRLLRGARWPARAERALRLASGTAGHELPEMATATIAVRPGDLVVLATDGVRPAFADALDPAGDPQQIAQRLLATHGRLTDDALVLVMRYLGVRR